MKSEDSGRGALGAGAANRGEREGLRIGGSVSYCDCDVGVM